MGAVVDYRTWLQPRLEGVPDSLKLRILRELDAIDDACFELVAHLRLASDHVLERLTAAGAGADPVDLLAADALMTYACEAMAEFDPSGLAEIR